MLELRKLCVCELIVRGVWFGSFVCLEVHMHGTVVAVKKRILRGDGVKKSYVEGRQREDEYVEGGERERGWMPLW